MSAAKRVVKELENLQQNLPPYLRDLTCNSANVLEWHVLLLPERPPYSLQAFKLCITFPREYPFMPPRVTFTTPIYHPGMDPDGQVCLPLISNENWTPSFRTSQVLEALNELVNHPELGQPVQLSLAEELAQDPEQFNKNAEEHTLQFGVQRPS